MRESVLDVRHRELGSKLDGDTWNGLFDVSVKAG